MTDLSTTPTDPDRTLDAPPSRWRGVLSIGLEALVSLAAALVCFLVFLAVLDAVFPSSIGLRRELNLDRSGRRATWGLEEIAGPRPTAAVLRVVSNDVRQRTPNQIAWASARTGSAVHEGDAVQTTRDGQAMLRFNDGSSLQLGRNSLLVVRGNDARARGSRSFQVSQGELWGSLPAQAAAEGEFSVNTPGAVVKVGTTSGSTTRADFKVSVGPDRTSIVAVYRGSASVTTGSRTQEVTANHFVAVDSMGVQTAPSRLPEAPSLIGPPDGIRYVYRDPPPRFEFQWKPVSNATEYRLVVARDRSFQSVVLDRRLSSPELAFGRLGMGDYSWRVSTIRGHAEGRPSATSTLRIVRDGAAPKLKVQFPDGTITTEECTITGVTEPGSRVFVAGQAASVDKSGNFTRRIRLKPGINVVVIEALDSAGNAAYSSKYLDARY